MENLEAREMKTGNLGWCHLDEWGRDVCSSTNSAPAEVATMSDTLEIAVAESAWVSRGR